LTQVEHIDGLSRQGNQVSGLSPFDKTEWSKKKQNLSHWTYDDGVLWFDRVDRGPEPFQHLVGNVAEYVVDGTDPLADLAPGQLPAGQALPLLRQRLAAAKKVSIIGGSAQWPQSVAHDQAQDVDWQKKDFGGNLLAAGFSDVGIRLAYTQPSDPLVLRLRKLLEARPYLAMPVVGAAAGAGDGP
jgi:hypothetical protein